VATVLLGSYLVRYPLGGMMSWVLQYLVGFRDLGHDVVFVEKAGYERSCYDPVRDEMTDDPTYGTEAVEKLLSRFGLGGRWCFVDAAGRYHGLSRTHVEDAFSDAVFVDMGTHGDWLPEAQAAASRVLVDGEPGFTQMKWEKRRRAGEPLPIYDAHFSSGLSVGSGRTSAPTAGRRWSPILHPVVPELFADVPPARAGAPFTTVMNWQSYRPVEFDGVTYGHKDVEFPKFMTLPSLATAPLELAVAGKRVPDEELRARGWRIRSAHEVTATYDAFVDYIAASRGELSVCKNGYVVLGTGWFSDRSGAYLASGRPVVLQETGWSAHLPTGRGLFAARDAEDAAAALEAIESDYDAHAAAARAIARERLDARRVLGRLLASLGVGDVRALPRSERATIL
jgi:hypothetical protein